MNFHAVTMVKPVSKEFVFIASAGLVLWKNTALFSTGDLAEATTVEFDTFRAKWNGWHFTGDIFKCNLF